VAQNRLILSGTPIQNNIQELWALFDFLMPGFLGSEAAFNSQFGKALKSGRNSKTGSSEAQAGLLAMEGLHKQASSSLHNKGPEPQFHQSQEVKFRNSTAFHGITSYGTREDVILCEQTSVSPASKHLI